VARKKKYPGEHLARSKLASAPDKRKAQNGKKKAHLAEITKKNSQGSASRLVGGEVKFARVQEEREAFKGKSAGFR